jgi:glycine cleavage system H protein
MDGEIGTIGITDHAQQELGDVVYIELPKPGATFDSGATFGSVESVKAVSELFMPVSGEVVEINEDLASGPEKINADPYGVGWMMRVRLKDKNETVGLMSARKYDEFTKEE